MPAIATSNVRGEIAKQLKSSSLQQKEAGRNRAAVCCTKPAAPPVWAGLCLDAGNDLDYFFFSPAFSSPRACFPALRGNRRTRAHGKQSSAVASTSSSSPADVGVSLLGCGDDSCRFPGGKLPQELLSVMLSFSPGSPWTLETP